MVQFRVFFTVFVLSTITVVPVLAATLCPNLSEFPESSASLHRTFLEFPSKSKSIETKQFGLSGLGQPLYVYKLRVPLNALDVTIARTNSDLNVVILGGLHAREWISITSVFCLLLHYSALPANTSEKSSISLHLIPVVNPDGYDYSKKVRHWRKTHPMSSTSPNGVDLNRNFGVENVSWGFGSKTRFSSELYQGQTPFSERESVALKNYIQNLPNSSVVLDVHCCARVVFPSIQFSSNRSSIEHVRIAKFLASRMNDVAPKDLLKQYKYRQRESTFSSSNTGILIDWINSQPNIHSAFMLEVRGKRNPENFRDLFRNKPEDIQPVAAELGSGFRGIVQYFYNLSSGGQSTNEAPNISAGDFESGSLGLLGLNGSSLTPQNGSLRRIHAQEQFKRDYNRGEIIRLSLLQVIITLCGWCCVLFIWHNSIIA